MNALIRPSFCLLKRTGLQWNIQNVCFQWFRQVCVVHQFSSGFSGLLFPLGLNVRATLLMQNRWPVGSGPSSNTCPRWASHCTKHTHKRINVISQPKMQKWGLYFKKILIEILNVKYGWDKHFTFYPILLYKNCKNFGFIAKNTTHIFTKDLCPSTTQAVVRATSDGGMAFITLPCPMSLFECRPACTWFIFSLWTIKRGSNISSTSIY